MESDNPLVPIWEAYQITKDCLKVTQRTVDRESEHFLKDTRFIGTSKDDATNKIGKSRSEAEDYVVLSLWVAFERFIINYVQEKSSVILQKQPSSFSRKFYDRLRDAVEYWKVDDVLDMFKNGWVNAELIGDAKNIKRYRDWLAHRNPAKASPAKVTPETAHRILLTLIQEIQNVSS